MEIALPLRSPSKLPRRHDPLVALRQAAARVAHAPHGLRQFIAFPPGGARRPRRHPGTRCLGRPSASYGPPSSPRCCRLSSIASTLGFHIFSSGSRRLVLQRGGGGGGGGAAWLFFQDACGLGRIQPSSRERIATSAASGGCRRWPLP